MVRRGVRKIPPKNRLRGVFEIHAFLPYFIFHFPKKQVPWYAFFGETRFFEENENFELKTDFPPAMVQALSSFEN